MFAEWKMMERTLQQFFGIKRGDIGLNFGGKETISWRYHEG